MPAFTTPELEQGGESPEAALRHEGAAWFLVDGSLESVGTRYYDRAALKAGNRLEGPAIVNQYDSTTVIPPGIAAESTASGTSSSTSAPRPRRGTSPRPQLLR